MRGSWAERAMSLAQRPGPGGPVLVFYDIADDADRAAVYDVLSSVGTWVQRSTWVLPAVPAGAVGRVVQLLVELVEPGDRILAVQPCPTCRRTVRAVPGPGLLPVERATARARLTVIDGGMTE